MTDDVLLCGKCRVELVLVDKDERATYWDHPQTDCPSTPQRPEPANHEVP